MLLPICARDDRAAEITNGHMKAWPVLEQNDSTMLNQEANLNNRPKYWWAAAGAVKSESCGNRPWSNNSPSKLDGKMSTMLRMIHAPKKEGIWAPLGLEERSSQKKQGNLQPQSMECDCTHTPVGIERTDSHKDNM